MTKLKNTKKGMAKKALSISLVAAMLATSNVPVWAAEFTDGTDAVVEAPVVEEAVDTFSAEAEAPVVEEEVNDVATYAATADASFTLKSWGETPVLAGTLVDDDGKDVTTFKYEWLIDGKQPVDADGNGILSDEYSGISNNGYNKNNWKDFLKYIPLVSDTGKTLTFHVVGTGANEGFEYTTPGVVIAPKNVNDVLADGEINVANSAADKLAYTGKPITLTASDMWVKDGVGLANTDFTYTYEGDTTNAYVASKHEGYIIATANKKGYTGSKKIALNITKATADEDSFTAKLNTKEFVYTGSDIVPTGKDVTVTNNYTKGTVNPDAVTGVAFANGAEGSSDATTLRNAGDEAYVKVTAIDVAKDDSLKDNVTIATNLRFPTKEKATVVARELRTTTIKVDDGTWVPGYDYNENDFKGYIHFYDEVGNEINLKNDITVTFPEIKGTGDYTLTISGKGKNVKGSITKTIAIRTNSLKAGVFTNETYATETEYYTGKEITKNKEKLGQFKLNGVALTEGKDYELVYSNNTDASTSTKKAKLTVKGIGSYGGEVSYAYTIENATIADDTISVPKTVLYDGAKISASDYLKKEDITVKASTKVRDEKGNLVDATIDVPADSYEVKFSINGNTGIPKLNDDIKTTVVVLDANFDGKSDKTVTVDAEKTTKIANRSLEEDVAKVEVVGGPYTYTGKAIVPELKVTYDGIELRKDKDYKILTHSNATDAGTASVIVQGMGDFSGSKTVTFTINPANIDDVVVTPKKDNESAFEYTGSQIKPEIAKFDVKLNGVDVSSNFTIAYPISSYDNVEVGTGKGTLTPLTGNKNFTGTKAFTFDILQKQIEIEGTITAWDEDGKTVTLYEQEANAIKNPTFHYDGTAKEFKEIKFTPSGASKDLKEGVDYEVKYYNNITGPGAAIYVNAIGNYTNKKDNKFSGSEQTYAKAAFFGIEGVEVFKENVKVSDSFYAGGLLVKPNVTITVGGRNLVEGTDYKFSINSKYDCVNVTPANTVLKATIEFIGGYSNSKDIEISWKIVAQDMANTEVKAVRDAQDNLNISVFNNGVLVPSTEYDVKENSDDTVTVTAKATSKNYTGSKTVAVDKEESEVGTPIIKEVKVVGNKATVILDGETDGATGYDYVISTENDYKNGRLPNGINKNQLVTETSYQYLDQGIYYAYCHAWKKVNGKKVFGGWSNIMPFSVSSITPSKPVITSVKVSKNTVKVTYTKSANATGYDLVLGKSMKKVNGEMRPVDYGKLVKKVYKGNTVTATFTKVGKGTYYAGLHAYNRTSEDGKKVFSPWSNAKKVVVK